MLSQGERQAAWERIATALNYIEIGYCAESHFWREWDYSKLAPYLKKKQIRGGAVAKRLRQAQADHLAPFAMSNRVGLVLTKLPKKSFGFGVKSALKKQSQAANDLLEKADLLARKLPGGEVAPFESYLRRIYQSYGRAGFPKNRSIRYDPVFLLSEQILAARPEVHKGNVRIAGQETKVLLLHMYPDAAPAWFFPLSTLSIPCHVSQIIFPIDKKAAMDQSERETKVATGTASDKGRESSDLAITDLANFRSYVTQNSLSIFNNSFIIHLHGPAEDLKRETESIVDWVVGNGGQVRTQDYIQLPYLRAGMPGQGYRVPMFRPDHGEQVANMIPAQVFKAGDPNPDSLRLGVSGQLIGFNYLDQKVGHSFVIAMTGSGKGVEVGTRIAETYALGMDYYIAEVGNSYEWLVTSLNGPDAYTRIEPEETVVNPLPAYDLADETANLPLNSTLAGTTINVLAFLLTDGRTELTVHERAAGQTALQVLYAKKPSHTNAPLLPDFHRKLEHLELESKEQQAAAKSMAANLESFLETAEGRIFSKETNLTLKKGICGVDLKNVDKANPKLLKFYLIFISLLFDQMAFSRGNPATVVLDEMHKFIAIAPEAIGKLIRELSRMGRKEAAWVMPVTQGLSEIDVIGEAVNSMPLRSLLYRSDDHKEIAERIKMPKAPLDLWKSFPYPINFDWRPSIQSIGDEYYNLYLTFPNMILDLMNSNPKDLAMKDVIAEQTQDPLERLQRFRAFKEEVTI